MVNKSFNNYPVQIPTPIKQVFAELIEKYLPHEGLESVDVYQIDNDSRGQHFIESKNSTRIVIFINATRISGTHEAMTQTRQDAEGIECAVTPGNPEAMTILSTEGTIIGEWWDDLNELDILVDLAQLTPGQIRRISERIFSVVNESVIKTIAYRTSWKHTANKESLIREVVQGVKSGKEASLKESRERLAHMERQVEEFRTNLKQTYDNMIIRRRSIESEEAIITNVSDFVIKELDQLAENPKVVDITYKDRCYIVETIPLYAYDAKGRRYYIGRFKIKLDISNGRVFFLNQDNTRKGYWSERDNHPHVNGAGIACLGNAAESIAQLCSTYEIHALALICIDFIESVNIADPAGARVRMWDMVDENGRVIKKGGTYELNEQNVRCEECGESVTHVHQVYQTVEEYMTSEDSPPEFRTHDPRQVCTECREAHYTYHEDAEEFILRREG